MNLRPERGGWHWIRPFGCGWFIREFLLGHGPEDSPKIHPDRGESAAEIRRHYKEAIYRAIARDAAEYEISDRVKAGEMLTEEQELEILEKYYRCIPRKITKVRYHSFMSYFGMLRRLGWVEPTGEEEPSFRGGIVTPEPWGKPGAIIMKTDELIPGRGTTLTEIPKPRRLFRLTAKGKAATEDEWRDPLQALHNYPSWRRQGKTPPKD